MGVKIVLEKSLFLTQLYILAVHFIGIVLTPCCFRSGDGGAGAYHRRKNHHQRPYRKRRRKFFRKNPNSESDIYSSSNYRRTVPRQSTYSWGAEPGKSKNYWYNGDYQEDFEESHDYYQPSLEKTYRDHYRYSENYQSSRREENLEEEEEYYYDDYEYTR